MDVKVPLHFHLPFRRKNRPFCSVSDSNSVTAIKKAIFDIRFTQIWTEILLFVTIFGNTSEHLCVI